MPGYDRIVPAGGRTGMPLNLSKKVARLNKSLFLADKRVLDCGCGPGDYLIHFLLSRVDAFGIEYDDDKVAQFRQNYPSYQDRISRGDLEDIQYPNQSFDLALFNEVLEHVPDDAKAIGEAFRVLKPGGFLAIFSPNRYFPFESHTVKLKLGISKLCRFIPPSFRTFLACLARYFFSYWARNYWPAELQKMVRSKGFHIIETDFIWQTFENISGQQPKGIAKVLPMLRKISNLMEKTPILRSFGITQYILAQKPVDFV